MPAPSLTIRNYLPADFEQYSSMFMETEKLGYESHDNLKNIVREALNRPGYSPGKDLFVVQDAGGIKGFMDILPEKGVERAVLKCYLQPEFRKQELFLKLLDSAHQRAKELNIPALQFNIPSRYKSAPNILTGLGFKHVRRHLDLVLDISAFPPADIGKEPLYFRKMAPGEEEILKDIQNRSFTGSWGYNPNTVEDIIYSLGLSRFPCQDVGFACDGDKITGFCWTRMHGTKGKETGQVFMLGVGPESRGKGIGKWVLSNGLTRLKSRGALLVELTVDSRNKAARSLYRTAGFKEHASSIWYEKTVA
ncbi:MAG: GNAT family N-acetyltransferase [Dehalococcoidia bacterium]|nr:GNAT family N-acetyltransferase [Dehalococcoidia bacterium]MDZ4246158.1 GNAT family N-acetyltransferase [Dehalococcoidia bacterium]